MKDFISYYNDQLNIEGSHINRSVFDGCYDRDHKLNKGITTLMREHLINTGAWDSYVAFNRVFGKMKQALNNISKKFKIANG